MNRIRYDFRRYRNFGCICTAMLKFCCLVRTGPSRLKGYCPRPDCRGLKNKTCVLYNANPVAYCYNCHRSMDAVEIVSEALGVGRYIACDELEILCASYLQCNS